jgi:hypothetical protein
LFSSYHGGTLTNGAINTEHCQLHHPARTKKGESRKNKRGKEKDHLGREINEACVQLYYTCRSCRISR